jgi:hypothetical protein
MSMTPTEAQARRMAGLNRARSDPRRNTPFDLKVLVAAFRRRWTISQIAFAAGMTRQRVEQRLRNYERQFGKIEQRQNGPKLSRDNHLRTFWQCAVCGKFDLSKSWNIRRRLRQRALFCSFTCLAEFEKQLPIEAIERAIDLRWQGKSWQSVARILKVKFYQQIQVRIFKHLMDVGLLDFKTVTSIWGHPGDPGHKVSWAWIERNLGVYVTETGWRAGPRNSNFSAWGEKLRDERIEQAWL